MDRVDKIAKNVFSRIKIAAEPDQIPWTFKEKDYVVKLKKSLEETKKNTQEWIRWLPTKEGEAIYDENLALLSMCKKELNKIDAMIKKVNELIDAIDEYENWLTDGSRIN